MRSKSPLNPASPVSRTAPVRRGRTTRLGIESLEERCVPSATLVADIVPGMGSSSPENLTSINGALYFNANRSAWKSDGTAAGTVLLHEFPVSPQEPTVFVAVNGTVLFNSSIGGGLWRTDGTAAGT